MGNAYEISVTENEMGSYLGKLRRRWEDNIKMDLKAIRYDSVE
jgi:hypothetical protein